MAAPVRSPDAFSLAFGADLHAERQDFLGLCQCRWGPAETDRRHFPTHRTHPGIDAVCRTHATVAAADDFCLLIDHDWDRIADWYHLDRERPPGVSAEKLYIEVQGKAWLPVHPTANDAVGAQPVPGRLGALSSPCPLHVNPLDR